jgi:cytochrome P450
VLWGASASRDPEVIERPEEFDISRKVNRHHSFGSGIHMCIGNALARAETKLVYKHLLARTTAIAETRGADSYESWGNGILDAAKRYRVRLVAR